MVIGLALLAARLGLGGAQAATRAAVQTVPKVVKPTGWGAYAKTSIVGGSIGAAGFGLSSAVGTAQESIEQGGGGLLAIGGGIIVVLLILFLLLRGIK